MRPHTLLALATLVLAPALPLGAAGAPPAAAPPSLTQPDPCTAGATTGSILDLQEIAENGSRLGLLFGHETQDVDINSTIHVHVCRDNFARWLDTVSSVRTPDTTDVKLLFDSSAELRKSAGFLEDAITTGTDVANQLASRGEEVRTTPEFQAQAQRLLAKLTESRRLVLEFWRSLDASSRADFRSHAVESRASSNTALTRGTYAYAAYLIEEIHWTLGRLADAQARLSANPPAAALVLAAARVQDGKLADVGLPNYSSLPIGEPQRFEKVTTVVSPEDMKKIEAAQKESTELAAILNDLVAGKAKLQDAVRQLLAARGIDLDKLQAALAKVATDVSQLQNADWKKIGDDLASRLEDALQETLTPAEKQLLDDKLRSQIDGLRARARELQTSLAGLVSQVQFLSAQVDDGKALAQDPAAALDSLLSLVQVGSTLASGGGLLDKLASGIAAADQVAKSLKADAAGVRQTLAGLKASLRQKILDVLSTTATDQLGQLSTDLAALLTQTQEVGDQLRNLFKSAEGTVDLAVVLDREPPVTSATVPIESVQDTWLDLQTLAGRKEGDTVVLQAWLYRVERVPEKPDQMVRKEELAHIDQPFRMLRFGFYSGPAAGLVYLRAAEKLAGQTEETRAFAPQVSWLLHYRPWRKPGPALEPFRAPSTWHDVLSAGIHTMSLDLDKDNQQEIGFGISLSFFGGYLQLGGGFDLSLGEKRYFFIGTQLFDLLRNPGVKTK
jgi:hypothetical protein